MESMNAFFQSLIARTLEEDSKSLMGGRRNVLCGINSFFQAIL